MKIQPLIADDSCGAIHRLRWREPDAARWQYHRRRWRGLAGQHSANRNPLATAAGAGAGLLLSESLHAGSTAAANKSYAAGYKKGRGESAKQQYHTLVEQQRQPAGTDEPATLFDIPLPEREIGGAILKPSTRTLRIQE